MATHDKTARVHLDLVDGFRFTASFPDDPGVAPLATDEAPPLGTGTGPNPAAMLATAVGTCLASSLLFCLRKARLSPENVSADVRAHITRNPEGRYRVDGIDVSLNLETGGGDEARVRRCQELFEEFCVVTESVRRGVPVDVHVAMHRAETIAEG